MASTRDQDWTFGPVSGPVCSGLAAAALALAEPVAHYPTGLPLGLAAAGGIASTVVAAVHKRPLGLVAYRASSWLAAGAWTTWTAASGWSWLSTGVLAAGGLVAGMLFPAFRELDEAAAPTEAATTAGGRLLTSRERVVKDAIDGLMNLRDPGVEIIGLDNWDNGSGYSVTLEFPAETGYGEEELQAIVVKLARRLRLANGCVPNAEPGEYQGQVLLRVPTVDDLSQVVDYPGDFSPLTVNEEHTIGVFGDRTPVTDEVREASKLIGGRKGGGKTNTMDVYCANFARCVDALVWHIDLNGGGMSVPWMLPYVEEDLEAPVVDWVAFDPVEALLMSEVALAITKARKAQYGRRAAKANSRLVPLDASVPEIVIMVDEGAEVLGETSPYKRLRDNLTEVMRLGRAVGVNLVVSTLRPTGDHIPVQVRKNCSTRIATKVEEDSELDYMFGYIKGLQSRMLKTRGEVFFYRGDEDGPSTVRKAKVFNLLPLMIADVCRATAHLRPALDPLGQKVGDQGYDLYGQKLSRIYADRWDRLAPWLNALREGVDVEELFGGLNRSAMTGEQDSQAAQAATATLAAPPSTEDALAAYERAKRKLQDETVEESVLKADEATIEGLFLSLVEPLRKTPPPATVQPTLAERVQAVAKIIADAGEAGVMRADIIAKLKGLGVDVRDTTVSEWLQAAEAEGLIRRGSKKGHWLAN